MKINNSFKLPEESILGFKVLSSFHSTISAYILLLAGFVLNPFFGTSNLQIKA